MKHRSKSHLYISKFDIRLSANYIRLAISSFELLVPHSLVHPFPFVSLAPSRLPPSFSATLPLSSILPPFSLSPSSPFPTLLSPKIVAWCLFHQAQIVGGFSSFQPPFSHSHVSLVFLPDQADPRRPFALATNIACSLDPPLPLLLHEYIFRSSPAKSLLAVRLTDLFLNTVMDFVGYESEPFLDACFPIIILK